MSAIDEADNSDMHPIANDVLQAVSVSYYRLSLALVQI